MARLELKITHDSEGNEVRLDSMSLKAAKSLIVLLDSATKIAEMDSNPTDLTFSITNGSITVSSIAENEIVNSWKQDLVSISEKNLEDQLKVDAWRRVQSLVKANGLHYKITFHNDSGEVEVVDSLKSAQTYRAKRTTYEKQVSLVFLDGELIENGGKKANLHLLKRDEEKIIGCSKQTATYLNQRLYQPVYLSAWEIKRRGQKNVYEYCDSYLNEEIYSDLSDFYNSLSGQAASMRYLSIHNKLKLYIDNDNFDMVNKVSKLFNHKETDITSLASILIITKYHENNNQIRNVRKEIMQKYNNKLKK